MYLRSDGAQGSVAYVLPRVVTSFALLLLGSLAIIAPGRPVPDFVRRIVHPCTSCYFGAFDPPLQQYGHQPRPNSDSANDGTPPVAVTLARSTAAVRPDGSAPWIAANFGVGARRWLPFEFGRAARDAGGLPHSFDTSTIAPVDGFAPGSATGVASPDSQTSVPGFAWQSLDPRSMADAIPGERIVGLTADATWRDPALTGLLADRGTGRDTAGPEPATDAAAAPRWHVVMRKELERHFVQIGGFGINANRRPDGEQPSLATDRFTVFAVDPTGRFNLNPTITISDPLTSSTTLIHESQPHDAGFSFLGFSTVNNVDTAHAAGPDRLGATVTPLIQYSHTAVLSDAVQYWPGTRSNSAGVVAEFSYAPWARPMAAEALDLRFAAGYTTNREFIGSARGGSGNNTLTLSLWGALHF